MILIDSKHFTSLNSGIISMRKNVGAIRKTLLKNRTLNLRLQTKQKLYDQQLKESEEIMLLYIMFSFFSRFKQTAANRTRTRKAAEECARG